MHKIFKNPMKILPGTNLGNSCKDFEKIILGQNQCTAKISGKSMAIAGNLWNIDEHRWKISGTSMSMDFHVMCIDGHR